MSDFYIYGLQRSGTNIIYNFMINNFDINIINHDEPDRKSPRQKHFRIYDNKNIIPETDIEKQYHNDIIINSIDDLDSLLGGKNKYIVVWKNIFSWLPSIHKWAKKCNWKQNNKLSFVDDYKNYMNKWISISNERVLFLDYEDFLRFSPEFILKIELFFQKPFLKKIENIEHVGCSDVFTLSIKKYYLLHKYLDDYNQNEFKQILNIQKLGTKYGGWAIPLNNKLNHDSIYYGGGVGEDISFDLNISSSYKCNVYLIDPTKRANEHYNIMKKVFEHKILYSQIPGDIQDDYEKELSKLEPVFDKIFYEHKGLWKKQDLIKFYKPKNKKYVSHSLISSCGGKDFLEVEVFSIKDMMKKHNHQKIDILKLDIEGAEIEVLEQMITDNIYPDYLLIEFDLLIKKKDRDNKTQKLITRLKKEYVIIENDNWNISMIHKNLLLSFSSIL